MPESVLDPVLNARIALDDTERTVTEGARFRRLGSVKQNGFTYLRYPRSTHTRAEHSFGVLYWASLMHKRLVKDKEGLAAVRMAALVHDVGHGPFSHAMEILLRRNPSWSPDVDIFHVDGGELVRHGWRPARGHEDFTLEFVGSELSEITPDLAPDVFRIISGEAGILSSILSSDVDADRMDYLIRDAHYSGIPFGRDLGTLFRSVVERSMYAGKKAGRDWIVVRGDAIRGIEIILAARFAAYRTIYHDPLSRSAESLLIAALEQALESVDEPRRAVRALFINGIDGHFHVGSSSDDAIREIVSNKHVRRAMVAIDRLKPWPERRLMTLGRSTIFNLIKVFENGRARELEAGMTRLTGGRVTANISIPNTLSPDLLVDEEAIHPEYRPAFLYDQSPLVKALEDSMYSTASIISSRDLGEAVSGGLDALVDSVSRKDFDTDRDVISAAILSYLRQTATVDGGPTVMKALQRRTSVLFGVTGRAMEALGRDMDLIPRGAPYYSRRVYGTTRLLVFLRALVEIPDDAPFEGTYIPSYWCLPGPGLDEVLSAVALSDETRSVIDTAVQMYLNERVAGSAR